MTLSLHFHSVSTSCIPPTSMCLPLNPDLATLTPTPPSNFSSPPLCPSPHYHFSLRISAQSKCLFSEVPPKQPARSHSPPQEPLILNFHVAFSPCITFWVVTCWGTLHFSARDLSSSHLQLELAGSRLWTREAPRMPPIYTIIPSAWHSCSVVGSGLSSAGGGTDCLAVMMLEARQVL